MCCAAMKHCLANNVLGISSRIQHVFPPADAASMLFIADTAISDAPCLLGCFTCSVALYGIHATLLLLPGGGQPALQYVACGVISFVAVHCLWNVEVKQGDNNQPMSEVWDWNMYGTKLKFHGWFINTANEDGDGGEDDASFASEHSDDEDLTEVSILRVVQVLAIRANFRISRMNAHDWYQSFVIYTALEGEVQEEGMDLVLTGPCGILQAYGGICLEVFTEDLVFTEDDEGSSTDDEGSWGGHFRRGWDVTDPDEVEEFTQTIYGGLGRKLEITYLVIPEAVETYVEVRLNLKDFGLRSRSVYGSVKAIAVDYGSKSVNLFSFERGSSLSLPCGSTCILPLGPHMIALPKVITTCDSQEEDKNLKFCLDCSRRIRSEERLELPRRIRTQEREFDGDQVEVKVIWALARSF
ncbi:hypothetical protein VPH35_015493 [Triticum aestivum]